MVKGSQPALGPKLDLDEICVQRGGNGGAEGRARHKSPESAVVSKSIDIVVDNIKEIIDENKKEQRGENAALGDTGKNVLLGGEGAANKHTLLTVREEAVEPGQ